MEHAIGWGTQDYRHPRPGSRYHKCEARQRYHGTDLPFPVPAPAPAPAPVTGPWEGRFKRFQLALLGSAPRVWLSLPAQQGEGLAVLCTAAISA